MSEQRTIEQEARAAGDEGPKEVCPTCHVTHVGAPAIGLRLRLEALSKKGRDEPLTSKSMLDVMVDRFLAWPLPKSVCADLCATDSSYKFPRMGTNLLNVNEARAMLEYVLGDGQRPPMPPDAADMLLKEIDELKTFVRRVAEYDDYTHDDVDETKILHDLQREAQQIL